MELISADSARAISPSLNSLTYRMVAPFCRRFVGSWRAPARSSACRHASARFAVPAFSSDLSYGHASVSEEGVAFPYRGHKLCGYLRPVSLLVFTEGIVAVYKENLHRDGRIRAGDADVVGAEYRGRGDPFLHSMRDVLSSSSSCS